MFVCFVRFYILRTVTRQCLISICCEVNHCSLGRTRPGLSRHRHEKGKTGCSRAFIGKETEYFLMPSQLSVFVCLFVFDPKDSVKLLLAKWLK